LRDYYLKHFYGKTTREEFLAATLKPVPRCFGGRDDSGIRRTRAETERWLLEKAAPPQSFWEEPGREGDIGISDTRTGERALALDADCFQLSL
jgi:hypothetical protein